MLGKMSELPHEVEIALLQKELTLLKDEVHSLSREVSGLVDAWKTASGVVAFVKWLAGAVTAIAILWTVAKIKIGSN
jgi:hypothetical protein